MHMQVDAQGNATPHHGPLTVTLRRRVEGGGAEAGSTEAWPALQVCAVCWGCECGGGGDG